MQKTHKENVSAVPGRERRRLLLLSIACGYYMSMLIEVSLDGAFGCFLKFFLEDFESAQLAV